MIDTVAVLLFVSFASVSMSIMFSSQDGPYDMFKNLRWLLGVRETVTDESEFVMEYVYGDLSKHIGCPKCLSISITLVNCFITYIAIDYLYFLSLFVSWLMCYIVIDYIWREDGVH